MIVVKAGMAVDEEIYWYQIITLNIMALTTNLSVNIDVDTSCYSLHDT